MLLLFLYYIMLSDDIITFKFKFLAYNHVIYRQLFRQNNGDEV